MIVDTNTMFSITEANQNFSKVAKAVDKDGKVVILKNNKPQYVITKFGENDEIIGEDELVELVARSILAEHKYAFEELGK